MPPILIRLLDEQAGVIARRQVLGLGLDDSDVARLVRRRELVRLHPGVYLSHTGEPSFLQQAWGAVLTCRSSALAGRSALRAAEGPGSTRADRFIEVAVDGDQTPAGRPGIRYRRVRELRDRVQWNLGPPRMRYHEAAVDVAAYAGSDFQALGELSRALQSRRTTAAHMRATIDGRARVPRRGFLAALLGDVEAGVCSVLEHGYLTGVERPHGLSTARRQVRDRLGSGVVYRDVECEGGLVLELDGRLFHDTTAQRDRDLDRDLVSATLGKDTVRLGYGQVFERPCWTAGHVAVLLTAHGWEGRPRTCGPTCPALAIWHEGTRTIPGTRCG